MKPRGWTRLFVYGTLKRSAVNAHLMAGARFVGEAESAEGYGLRSVGGYPVLAPAPAGRVAGEVFLVSPELLETLDEFEGCPTLYQRVELALSSGERAHAYGMEDAALEGAPWIRGGVWAPP